MLRTLFSFRGLILVFGLVALGLPIALLGQLGMARSLNQINQDLGTIRLGQLAAAEVLEYQLDEDTSVRGYASTGKKVFLEPYQRARAAMPGALTQLRAILAQDKKVPDADDLALSDLEYVNQLWLRTVADPIVGGGRRDDALLLNGKRLIDRFRADTGPINARFTERYHAAVVDRDKAIRATTTAAVLAIAVIAIEIVVFAVVMTRMRYELDRERGFVETLQSAASVRLVPPPHLAVGRAYRSATRGARVGGDLYDVYRLDSDFTLIVIGDVSGKGLAAAVDTTFVRFAVRALASEGLGPPEIVHRFDGLYRDANGAPESFVTLFVGIHDRRDGSLVYTNAGHEACWIRRGDEVEMLPPTGPIVGLAAFDDFTFRGERTHLAPGDMLVLATDGLTEARDPQGGFMAIERITAWIREGDARTPQLLVDALLRAVAARTRGRITDDLAILAVQPLP